MGARMNHVRERSRACKRFAVSRSLAAAGARSRAGLLLGGWLIALAALGAPGAAQAACTGSTQTISTPVTGPIISNGGAITVNGDGVIAGHPDGIDASACPITTLSAESSSRITGGTGAAGAAGGVGVSNANTITTLSNATTIAGGNGGAGGAGGAGVSNSGTIKTIHNAFSIIGGNGGAGGSTGGAGGAGLSNSGTITTLSDSDSFEGGVGGHGAVNGGAGGAGVYNSGTITALTINYSSGIDGGDGGQGGSVGGAGGAGIFNSGTITTLTNNLDISGGLGGTGHVGNGALGDAIYSTGSIGSITNLGAIYGTVEIDNQARVTINGPSGGATASIGGGAITIGNGDLVFTGNTGLAGVEIIGENPALDNHIFVDGGAGEVTNEGVLSLVGPETVMGNFVQTSSSVLDFMLGYGGALDVSELATLDGELALNDSGSPVKSGDVFDLINYGGVSGAFSSLSLDGKACSATGSDAWFCHDVGNLDLDVGSGSLELTVTGVPEPATWALIAAGFFGLGMMRGAKGLVAKATWSPSARRAEIIQMRSLRSV